MISVWNIIMSATSGKSFLWRNTVDMQEWLFANRDAASNVLTHWNQTKPCMATWLTCDNDERWIQSLKGVNCTFNLHKRLVFHGTSHIDSIIIMPYQEWYIGLHIARYYYYSHLIYIYKTKKALYKCNICLYMQRVCLHGSHQVHSRFRYIERCFQVSMDLSERHNWQETWL